MSLTEYQEKIYTMAQVKFFRYKGTHNRESIPGPLDFNLFISHELRNLFIIKPTFQKYIDVDEAYRRLVKFSIPIRGRREKLCELLE